jgi:hypothetical protein
MGAAVLLLATLLSSAAERDVLTRAELMSAADGRVGLVDNRYFLPVGDAGEAHEAFAGTIVIADNAMSSQPAEISMSS